MEHQSPETLAYLQHKASLLPKSPGVYIMENGDGKVIYVGKSRALKNRVSQYFHGAHDIKTAHMAENVRDFRFITCDTEMEALVLENNLIKQYTPKYNILLKDAKSYPYIKVSTEEEYPRVFLTRKRGDKGVYFGPYSGVGTVYGVIGTLERVLGLPTCKRTFPKDIGKSRPCVYRQIGRCCGVCAGDVSREEYGELIKCAIQLLKGNTGEVEDALTKRMCSAAENERFEEAARCRDSIAALKRLGEKQKTQLSPDTDCDVIGLAEHEGCACAAVIYIRGGIICDSEYFMFGADEIVGNIPGFLPENNSDVSNVQKEDTFAAAGKVRSENVSGEACSQDEESPFAAFLVNLYRYREHIPKDILLSFPLSDGDRSICEEYFSSRAGRKINLRTPVRGEGRKLCLMACRDAVRHSQTRRKKDDSDERLLATVASVLHLEVVPERIECYDISNLGSEHITAGMIVCENGRLKKSDYRYFRIKGQEAPDDYAAMRQTISRRLSHLTDGSDTSFSRTPDLILLDGGAGHVSVISDYMREAGFDIPVFGMIKDEHHKTRTLVSPTGEVSIVREPEVFRLVYRLQEEVHRFTVSRMTQAKRNTLKHSSLEKIDGIGPAKAKELMRHFGSLNAIKNATSEDLQAVAGISSAIAENIIRFFDKSKKS